MDTAVGLVNAYLQLNGYLTVTEYPLIEWRRGSARMATDLDVIAFRFPHAGQETRSRGRRMDAPVAFKPDPELGGDSSTADMVIGEVKEGQAGFNLASNDPLVLASGLARFGCCRPEHAQDMARNLIRHGATESDQGHKIRMVAFGSRIEAPAKWHAVSTAHIIKFLMKHLNDHWGSLRHVDLKDDVLSLFALMRKSRLRVKEERHE
jgi:hypothetical protein